MDYSYQLLPLLVAIIEEKHLGRAGARMKVSQPAVSRALTKLREQYKDPLVVRTANGVEPTLFAKQIYPTLLKSLNDLDSTFSSNVTFNPQARPYRFSIACTSLTNYSLIPYLVNKFSNTYPNIGIDIHLLTGSDINSQLRNKEHDFVIDADIDDSRSLRKEVLYKDKLVLCCSKNHKRIKSEYISMQDFMKEKHVTIANWKKPGNLISDVQIKGIDARKISVSTVGTLESLCLVGRTDYVCLSDMKNVLLFSELFSIKPVQLLFYDSYYNICLFWHPSKDNDCASIWFRSELVKIALDYYGSDIGYL